MLGTGTRPSAQALGTDAVAHAVGIIATDDRGLVTSFSANLGDLGLDAAPERLGRHWSELLPSFRRLSSRPGSGDDDFVVIVESTRTAFRVTRVPFVGAEGTEEGAFLVLRAFDQADGDTNANQLGTLSELAAGVAHEINNPLTTISGWMQIFLADAREDDPIRSQFSSIQEELDRIARIVDKLLAFAQKPSAEFELVDANETIRNVASFLEYQMLHANVQLKAELAPCVSCIEGNPSELKQVLLNLLLNARQAMPEGGRLRITTCPSADGAFAEIRVEDTGRGVPAEIQGQLFEPYFTTRREDGGTGLGLSVSREIIRRMKGELELESTSPAGSTFLIRLPVAEKA
jgi:signal transduction histidine kinase